MLRIRYPGNDVMRRHLIRMNAVVSCLNHLVAVKPEGLHRILICIVFSGRVRVESVKLLDLKQSDV